MTDLADNTKRSFIREHSMSLIILSAVSAVIMGWTIVALSMSSSLMIDDGYYYLQIAWHLAQGHGSTFDGINLTNGYHPLWQFLLVPLFWLGLGKQGAIYAATLLQTVCFLCSGWLLYGLLFRSAGTRLALTAACLWILNPWLWNKAAVSGMEMGLVLACLGASCWLFMEVLEGRKPAWLLGVSLALLTGARIDSLPFSLAIILMLLFRRTYRQACIAAIPLFVYLAFYFVLNAITFGHMLPVSGSIKSASGRALLEQLFNHGDPAFFWHGWENLLELATLRGRIPAVAMLAVPIGLVVFAWMLKGHLRTFLAVCSLYVLGFFGYYAFMYESLISTYTYYFIPIVYLACACLFFGIASLPYSKIRVLIVIGMVTVELAFSVVYLPNRLMLADFTQPVEKNPRYAVIQFINQDLPDSAIVGCWDAGEIGYRTNKPVVNLDGLVNSYHYQDMLRENRLASYLTKTGITHLTNYDDERRLLIEKTLNWDLLHEISMVMAPQATLFSRSPEVEESLEQHRYTYYVFQRPSMEQFEFNEQGQPESERSASRANRSPLGL